MSKYVIECPDCGSYVEIGTGLFAKKKVKCTCGHVINANTDKMTSKGKRLTISTLPTSSSL